MALAFRSHIMLGIPLESNSLVIDLMSTIGSCLEMVQEYSFSGTLNGIEGAAKALCREPATLQQSATLPNHAHQNRTFIHLRMFDYFNVASVARGSTH